MKISEAHKALIASYGRSLLATAIATYTDTQYTTATLNAVWAAAIPTALRYLNPKDTAFGKGADETNA